MPSFPLNIKLFRVIKINLHYFSQNQHNLFYFPKFFLPIFTPLLLFINIYISIDKYIIIRPLYFFFTIHLFIP